MRRVEWDVVRIILVVVVVVVFIGLDGLILRGGERDTGYDDGCWYGGGWSDGSWSCGCWRDWC